MPQHGSHCKKRLLRKAVEYYANEFLEETDESRQTTVRGNEGTHAEY